MESRLQLKRKGFFSGLLGGTFFACRLEPKPGGNDPLISLSLYGSADALQIVISRNETDLTTTRSTAFQHDFDKQEKIKQALINICCNNAAKVDESGPQLSGEFFLNRVERRHHMQPTVQAEYDSTTPSLRSRGPKK